MSEREREGEGCMNSEAIGNPTKNKTRSNDREFESIG